ncbi:MAG: hypothetical protein ACI8P9_002804 [Parasphingorhabdus sp.]|jgi:hypothetical protein
MPEWWDPHSSQPYKIPSEQKPRLGLENLTEYLKVAATAIGLSPLILLRYLAPPLPVAPPSSALDFIGLSVTPDSNYNGAIADMVEDLGVRRLLLRIPAWEADNLEMYTDFLQRFPANEFVVNILQSRDSVARPETWRAQLNNIFDALQGRVWEYQIGNAINRSKWGCRHTGDYLDLMNIATDCARRYQGVKLAGSSVIDFEPLLQIRTLLNRHPHSFQYCASLLYVNRRGSPQGKQYGFFDLQRKIRLNYAILSLSNKCPRRLWISETNWPLLDSKPWTPNSGHPRSTVDEATQANYLTDYYKIAWQSGMVERVYWWQLINPGYGLVDHRSGQLRKMPSYFAFQALLEGGLQNQN